MDPFDLCNLFKYLNVILNNIDPFKYNTIESIQFVYYVHLE
jgi:hypothetical protein